MSQSPTQSMSEQPYGGRTPGAMRYIGKLEATIAANDEQMKDARRQIMWHSALVEDLQEEGSLYQQALDTANKQNTILRRRLGLPETGDIEYSEEETVLFTPSVPTENEQVVPVEGEDHDAVQPPLVTPRAAAQKRAMAQKRAAGRRRS